MSTELPSARELTRRLVVREAAERDASDDAAVAAYAACERVYRTLTRWLGATGTYALFARALSEARVEHAALRSIRLRERSEAGLDGVTEGVGVHGTVAVAAGLEAMLAALIQLVGRLIGGDMAVRLLEQSLANSDAGRGEQRADEGPR